MAQVPDANADLLQQIDAYAAVYGDDPREAQTVDRFRQLLQQPTCFERNHWEPGHVTGSCWLLDPAAERLLLTHHRKLDMWVQLGGHSDGDPDVRRVALREAEEESGVAVRLLEPQILDLDIHEIPARKSDPAHLHFDVRYALISEDVQVEISAESIDLAWVPLPQIEEYTREASILRMREKWRARAEK